MASYPDRRDFLVRTGGAAGLAALLGSAACRDASREAAEAARTDAPPTVLTPEEVRTLEAVADRILPPGGDGTGGQALDDDGPGAKDLGAVVFIDRFVARDGGTLEGLRAALGVLAETAGGDVADRTAAQQDEALRAFEAHPSGLFGLVRFLVLAGAFAGPKHGGNRDGAGWALLGFQDRHAWQPPFGAYDGPAAGEGA
ncbi:MAG: gluconate 2-dehydrogenase subunit 3 family protein [Longimicrobiales bacterium]